MDIFTAIHTRRSIRKFEDRDVPRDLIHKILDAAMMAPSAGNAQPWQFVVITDRKKLAGVVPFNPYAAMAAKAPLGILVCGDPRLEKYPGYWVQDCAAATQNLLLAAHGSGLGAVWTGIYPMQDRVENFRRYFGLPDAVVPLGLVVLGWPDQRPGPENRFKPERIHDNHWRDGAGLKDTGRGTIPCPCFHAVAGLS